MFEEPSSNAEPAQARVKLAIVVPVYRQDHNLRKTLVNLRSVTEGLSDYSITILNNKKEEGVVQTLLPEFDFHYVENDSTLPISENWNKCIEVANGEWVHILHEDDTVEPDFYKHFFAATLFSDEFEAFVARHNYINGDDLKIGVGMLIAKRAGIFPDMARWQAYRNVVQPPCIVVKKSVYQRIGNFRSDLRYTLDWEMWYRICRHCRVWYDPETLVNYRIHDNQLTTDEKNSGNSARDVIKGYEVIAGYCDEAHRPLALDHVENHILVTAKQYFRQKELDCAKKQLMILLAWRPATVVKGEVVRMLLWYVQGKVKAVLRKS